MIARAVSKLLSVAAYFLPEREDYQLKSFLSSDKQMKFPQKLHL